MIHLNSLHQRLALVQYIFDLPDQPETLLVTYQNINIFKFLIFHIMSMECVIHYSLKIMFLFYFHKQISN